MKFISISLMCFILSVTFVGSVNAQSAVQSESEVTQNDTNMICTAVTYYSSHLAYDQGEKEYSEQLFMAYRFFYGQLEVDGTHFKNVPNHILFIHEQYKAGMNAELFNNMLLECVKEYNRQINAS